MTGGGSAPCPACGGPWAEAGLPARAEGGEGVPAGRAPRQCRDCRRLWFTVEHWTEVLLDLPRAFAGHDVARLRAEGRARREASVRAALDGAATAYLPCPECARRMNRVNFAGVSGIVFMECRDHGVLVAAEDWPALLDFVTHGGEVLALEQERDELRKRVAFLERRLRDERRPAPGS